MSGEITDEQVGNLVRGEVDKALTETAQVMGAVIDKLYGPKWRAQANLANTIITVASGILVLAVTFKGSLLGSNPTRNVVVALLGIWGLMLISVVCGIVSLRVGVARHTYPIELQNLGEVETESVLQSLPELEIGGERFQRELKNVGKELTNKDRLSSRLLYISYWTLVIGMVLLTAVGARTLLQMKF